MNLSKNLTNTELEIMNYIWSVGNEVSAKDIRSHFEHKKWSKQAVSSFLKKLSNNGYLNIRKESTLKYYYSAAITEEDYKLTPTKELVKKFYSGSISRLVCALANAENASEDTIKELESIISEIRKYGNE